MGILIASLITFPESAYATCVNTIQSQTIAAAYEGDTTPTVHTMDTCGGDDVSYQIPIATTITFDGVQYSNIYATTNSVITFGQPDNTYWTYPNTPSISLYSMDWVSGWYNAPDTLNISYSEGGFQLDLEVIPFGQWNAPTPTNINIIVAITNTGGISVAYSYQGPEYPNLRTGVRLHNGDIVSLEAWGATQIQPGSAIPTLAAEPISGSIVSPTPTPITQEQVAQAAQTASDISNINTLIANINGDTTSEPIPEPTVEPTIEPTPEPTSEPTQEPTTEPEVIVVEPEIVTPEDPRFPDEENQSENIDTNVEPSIEPNKPDIIVTIDESNNAISEAELKKLNKSISENDVKLLAKLIGTNETIKQAVEEFASRAEENKNAPMPYTIADAITEVQAEKFLQDPIGALTNVDLKVLASPSEWGKDMTDDQREKIQEIVVPVIIASNIVAASMTRRNK